MRVLTSSIGLVGILSMAACAMPGDMERLDQSVGRKVDALASTLRNEVKDLRAELRTQERRHDELGKLLDSLKTVVYSTTESLRRSNEALERQTKVLMQALTDGGVVQAQLVKDHQQLSEAMGRLTHAVDTLTPLSNTLEGQVRQVTTVLQDTMRTEVKMLRERLRVIEELGHAPPGQNGDPPAPAAQGAVLPRHESQAARTNNSATP